MLAAGAMNVQVRESGRQENEMSQAPLVSIIIPTFNRAGLLPAAVRSVLAQTWRPLELVVVNDGSTDNTQEVLSALEPEARSANVAHKFITKENGGVCRARNAGVDAASGDYFGFLDDDDSFDPRKTELQVAALKASHADAACCYVTKVTADGQ